VQILGATGDVTDIGWLQFQLREVFIRTQQPTGAVVTFSNSLVLASPATVCPSWSGRTWSQRIGSRHKASSVV